ARIIVEGAIDLVRAESDAEEDACLLAMLRELRELRVMLRRHRLSPALAQERIALGRVDVEREPGPREELRRFTTHLPRPRLAVEALDHSKLRRRAHARSSASFDSMGMNGRRLMPGMVARQTTTKNPGYPRLF